MQEFIIRQLGLQPYQSTLEKMHHFTVARSDNTADEIWLVQHPPIFTLGRNAKPEHILSPSNIPVYQSDRGGEVTYHAPGQLIAYLLIDMRRRGIKVRQIVDAIESSVITSLKRYGVSAYAKREAPGVYIDDKKICSLGLRVTKGCTLHGLALNINMDLSPFNTINPCGYAGLEMTQLADFTDTASIDEISPILINELSTALNS